MDRSQCDSGVQPESGPCKQADRPVRESLTGSSTAALPSIGQRPGARPGFLSPAFAAGLRNSDCRNLFFRRPCARRPATYFPAGSLTSGVTRRRNVRNTASVEPAPCRQGTRFHWRGRRISSVSSVSSGCFSSGPTDETTRCCERQSSCAAFGSIASSTSLPPVGDRCRRPGRRRPAGPRRRRRRAGSRPRTSMGSPKAPAQNLGLYRRPPPVRRRRPTR